MLPLNPAMMYGGDSDNRKAKEWETGGSKRFVNVISTALAGKSTAEVVASELLPAVNNQIFFLFKDIKFYIGNEKVWLSDYISPEFIKDN